jgi:hypothetical protein
MTKRVAVMQPYFFPYAGYFRLFEAVDEFVIFDCVQFPRRGRVHRCEVDGANGGAEWLTLPIAKAPRDALIRDLVFAPGARAEFDARLARLPWYKKADGPAAARLRAFLEAPLPPVVDFLANSLRLVVEILGLEVALSRSSTLALPPALHGEERVLAIAKACGATRYVNASGGRSLYDAQVFARAGLELSFLDPYHGPFMRLLPALMQGDPAEIAADVRASTSIHIE